MKKFASGLALAVIGSIIAVSPAIAGSASDALSTCVADSTTGKERKDLAQWFFVAMTAHPDIRPFSNVTDGNRDELDKKMAALATRLIVVKRAKIATLALNGAGYEYTTLAVSKRARN